MITKGLKGASQGSVVKNPPSNVGDRRDAASIPGLGRSLEKEMATHSNVVAWEILWTEEPGELQRVRHDRVTKQPPQRIRTPDFEF